MTPYICFYFTRLGTPVTPLTQQASPFNPPPKESPISSPIRPPSQSYADDAPSTTPNWVLLHLREAVNRMSSQGRAYRP
jgi:hypothetical protein